MFRLKTKAGFS